MLAFAAMLLAPAGFTAPTLPRSAVSVRTGHVRAQLSADQIAQLSSPEFVGGVLAVGAVGALLLKGEDEPTAASGSPAQPGTAAFRTKIAALKAEGEKTIARRAAAAAAADEMAALAARAEVVGKVVPIEETFKRFDTDNSGGLDIEEMREAMVASGGPSDDATVRETMEALDTNNDGVVSLEEFKAAPREKAWWEQSPNC